VPGQNYFNKIFAGYFSTFKTLRSKHSELCERSSNAEGREIHKKMLK